MDFFAAQDRARAASRRLAWLFDITLLAVMAAVGGGTWYLMKAQEPSWGEPSLRPAWVAAGVAGGCGMLIAITAWFRANLLREGGSAVAQMLGGTLLRGDEGAAEQRLMNVVEEMAIASGVPLPQVYVLRDEPAINAFAAGHGPGDAVVAVTAGALQAFDRDQLQAVVAHEFSHLLNGDMALNLRLMAKLHGLMAVSQAGSALMRLCRMTRPRQRNDPRALLILIGLLLWLAGSVGHVCGLLLRAAICRSREFLADASAVQFTRYPAALAAALRLISRQGSRLTHARAGEAAHLYFADGVVHFAGGWLATHPPIAERIARLEGPFPEPDPGPPPTPAPAAELPAAAVSALVGTITPERTALVHRLVAHLPPDLRQACGDPVSARFIAVILVLEDDPLPRRHQLDCCLARMDAAQGHDLVRLARQAGSLPGDLRLPLANLAIPALRQLTPEQRVDLLRLLTATQHAVPRPSLLPQVRLRRLVVLLRSGAFPPTAGPISRRLGETALLLSALAASAGEAQAARSSFAAAAGVLLGPGRSLPMTAADAIDGEALGRALDGLLGLPFSDRRRVVDACAAAAAVDGRIQAGERECLSLAADALGCPLPPLTAVAMAAGT